MLNPVHVAYISWVTGNVNEKWEVVFRRSSEELGKKVTEFLQVS